MKYSVPNDVWVPYTRKGKRFTVTRKAWNENDQAVFQTEKEASEAFKEYQEDQFG